MEHIDETTLEKAFKAHFAMLGKEAQDALIAELVKIMEEQE